MKKFSCILAFICLNYLSYSQWQITGNSGTNPANHFIGTTDNQPLVFKTNNAEVMRLLANGNLGIGTNNPQFKLDINGSINTNANIYLPASTSAAGIVYMGDTRFLNAIGTNNLFLGLNSGNPASTGTYNTGIGTYTLNENTTGWQNLAIGNEALRRNTGGSYNMGMGSGALYSNLTGSENTAVGYSALFGNTSGNENTGVGNYALSHNTTGNENIAIGSYVLYQNTTGIRNIAIGNVALVENVSGNDNTAVGTAALNQVTASFNTGVGKDAGSRLTTGTGNAFFGSYSGTSIETGSNNSFFGYNIYNSGVYNLTGSGNTAIGANITGMGTGNNNTVIGAGINVPNVNNNIILADGQGNQRIRVFDTGNTLIGYTTYTDNGYKLDINGSLRSMGPVTVGEVTAPSGVKLAVGGNVIAEKITVKLIANWADYVFEKDYHLPPLTEVEKYIIANKHLPDVPSEKEITENGIDLGDNQAVLLRKIEELTLYIIEQQKQIDELKKEVKKK